MMKKEEITWQCDPLILVHKIVDVAAVVVAAVADLVFADVVAVAVVGDAENIDEKMSMVIAMVTSFFFSRTGKQNRNCDSWRVVWVLQTKELWLQQRQRRHGGRCVFRSCGHRRLLLPHLWRKHVIHFHR